mgnify:CR=1 FL=1
MSVLACNRQDCERVMCDHYSPEHGYICWHCLQELKEKAREDGIVDVYKFMATSKGLTDRAATLADIDEIFQER